MRINQRSSARHLGGGRLQIGIGGRLPPERVAGFKSESVADFKSEWVADFPRNPQHSRHMFDDTALEMAKGAYKIRQVTGHGAIGRMSNPEIRNLWGDVLAMEALCAARTIVELPLSEAGRKHLNMHPLFRTFEQLRDERAKAADRRTGDTPNATLGA